MQRTDWWLLKAGMGAGWGVGEMGGLFFGFCFSVNKLHYFLQTTTTAKAVEWDGSGMICENQILYHIIISKMSSLKTEIYIYPVSCAKPIKLVFLITALRENT